MTRIACILDVLYGGKWGSLAVVIQPQQLWPRGKEILGQEQPACNLGTQGSVKYDPAQTTTQQTEIFEYFNVNPEDIPNEMRVEAKELIRTLEIIHQLCGDCGSRAQY